MHLLQCSTSSSNHRWKQKIIVKMCLRKTIIIATNQTTIKQRNTAKQTFKTVILETASKKLSFRLKQQFTHTSHTSTSRHVTSKCCNTHTHTRGKFNNKNSKINGPKWANSGRVREWLDLYLPPKKKKRETVDTLGGNEPAKAADVADAEEKADSALNNGNWPVAGSIAEPRKKRSTFSKEVLQRVILPAKEWMQKSTQMAALFCAVVVTLGSQNSQSSTVVVGAAAAAIIPMIAKDCNRPDWG